MIFKFIRKYAKRITSMADSAFSETEEDSAADFVPIILLCGSADSGRSRIFGRLIATQTDIPDRVGSRMRSDSTEKGALEAPLMSGSEDDDSSVASGDAPARRSGESSPYHKVKRHMHSICNIRSKILEIPEDARADAAYLASREGTICYVLALDSYDTYLEDDDSGLSVLEQEIQTILMLAALRRSTDSKSFMVLLTKTAEFEAKMESPEEVAKLPEFLRPVASKRQSKVKLSVHIAQAMCAYVQKLNKYSTVNAYLVSDLDSACITMSAIVKTLYVKNELAASGFLA